MILKLSAAALVLALAIPAFAQTTATITQGPADTCGAAVTATDGTVPATDCAAAKPGKLGSGITPLAASDSEQGEAEGEGEDD
jgi:DNA-binding transcriptional regulator YdaS (Cro superfamily)